MRAFSSNQVLRRISLSGGTLGRFYRCLHSSAIVRPAKLLDGDIPGVKIAAREIKLGRLVAFPTETVYGLGANAFNADAVQSIFTTKMRPNSDPLIVHVSSAAMMKNLYDFTDALDAQHVCRILSNAFWPGPLTIIFKANSSVPSVVTAGTGYVGVRCPKHHIALALIHESGLPIAAPSANRFGHVSPTTADHVLNDLGHAEISIIRDDVELTGGCSIGVESTVCKIDADGRTIRILRCGAVTANMIQVALEESNVRDCVVIVDNERHLKKPPTHTDLSVEDTIYCAEKDEPAVAPGQMLKHYAPDIPTYIVRNQQSEVTVSNDAAMIELNYPANSAYTIHTAMVIDYAQQLAHLQPVCKHYLDLSSQSSAEEACFRLFDVLRQAESEETRALGVTHVLLPDLTTSAVSVQAKTNIGSDNKEMKGTDGLVVALWERLHRAASGTFV